MKPQYSKVQGKNTLRYGNKQYTQLYTCIPQDILQFLGLSKSVFLKWTPNEDGTVILAKCRTKPASCRLTYKEWLAKIRPHIPTGPPGKNPFEIYSEAGITKRSVPPIWVERAKTDINLQRPQDPCTHKILWYKLRSDPSPRPQKMIDLKLTQLS
jgi:hypothetical protein